LPGERISAFTGEARRVKQHAGGIFGESNKQTHPAGGNAVDFVVD